MPLSRRRFLSIASAACLAGTTAQAFQWQGTAMGARARIILDHPAAERITQRATAEIDRLEDIFSLYRPHSEIRRLNADGQLYAPSFELLDCLSIARRVHRLTEGRFDPTIQPLWQTYAEAFVAGHRPKASALNALMRDIGFQRVRFEASRVTVSSGQQITLNGIAQGYIADRIAQLMAAEGVADVLIDTGEILALGTHEQKGGWPVTIAGDAKARILSGRALATSAPFGTVFPTSQSDQPIQTGHILDPRRGTPSATKIRQISVSAPQAALADALSTGLCLAKNAEEAERLLRNVKDATLENVQMTDEDTQILGESL